VIGPDVVADRIVSAIERDRAEIFVPRWYRAVALAQAIAPGAFRRVGARRAPRDAAPR
jgi:short-subunit dehydrogenase